VRGWFKQGLFRQDFTRDLVALSREQALERLYSEIGSRHKLKRNLIHITEVKEVKPEEVTDPRVLAMLR
jgi:large subunit ribosomal protein LX